MTYDSSPLNSVQSPKLTHESLRLSGVYRLRTRSLQKETPPELWERQTEIRSLRIITNEVSFSLIKIIFKLLRPNKAYWFNTYM